MSYRRNTTTHAQSSIAMQRSYVVKIDAGAFAKVEIVVVGGGGVSGSGYHREGGRTPPRSPTVTATSKSHGYTHVPIPSTKRSPFSPLQTPPAPPDARTKRTYEREQRRMAEEKREEVQRQRREEARLAEARRAAAAAAAEEEARQRRRRRHAEQQRQEQQRQKEEERALREERRRRRLERSRLARDREIASAWRTYEARWGLLSQSQRQPERGLGLLGALTFERIPWPVAKEDAAQILRPDETVQALDALRPKAIREFLLSSAHSPDVSPKDRIRAALRRWHPDKFARVLSLVIESDRDAVAEGMGIVVRCLNDMLERENHA